MVPPAEKVRTPDGQTDGFADRHALRTGFRAGDRGVWSTAMRMLPIRCEAPVADEARCSTLDGIQCSPMESSAP